MTFSRAPFLLLGPVLCALAVAACSSTSVPTGAVDVNPDGDEDDAGARSEPDADATTENDASDGSAAYASDPLNCGGSGHSCLGKTCTAGICAPEVVRPAFVRWVDVDTNGDLVTVHEVSGAPDELRTGPPTPGATGSLRFTGDLSVLGLASYAGGSLFKSEYFSAKDHFVRWSGAGGGAGTRAIVAESASALYKSAVDATSVFFVGDGALNRADVTGANLTRLGGTALYAYSQGVALDTASAYVFAKSAPPTSLSPTVLARIPKGGGQVVESTLDLVPTGLVDLSWLELYATTPTRLVGSGLLDPSLYTNCDALPSVVWSTTKDGKNAKALSTTSSGRIHTVKTRGEYVYWVHNACSGSPLRSQILRRRADGSDATLVIAELDGRFESVAVDDTHVYWTDFGLYRAAR